jgi:uncharacterized membrane protein
MKQRLNGRKRVVLSLAALSGVSLIFLLIQVHNSHSLGYWYLAWNLFLAWTPLLFAGLLLRLLQRRLWSNWLAVIVTFAWLIMLPNSFYMISDFIHVREMTSSDVLYGVIMFTSFIFTAALVGFCSLYVVHAELRRRLGHKLSTPIVALILFVCSFAIYLGRDLRWNSWDVLVNPAGILFDISDRIIHPFGHSGIASTTLSFFVLLSSLYVVGWQVGEATRESIKISDPRA